MTLTMVAAGALLAGCSGEAEPAAPPPSEEALTTSDTAPTTDAAPTTEEPPDDVVETTAPPDVVETTEAGGPPEMPEVATEDSEAGAKAFASYYLDTFNYSTSTPASGLLEELSDNSCETCNAFLGIIAEYTSENQRTDGPILTYSSPTGTITGDHAVLFVDAVQTVPARLDADGNVVKEAGESETFKMVIRLKPTDSSWLVTEIQVGQ